MSPEGHASSLFGFFRRHGNARLSVVILASSNRFDTRCALSSAAHFFARCTRPFIRLHTSSPLNNCNGCCVFSSIVFPFSPAEILSNSSSTRCTCGSESLSRYDGTFHVSPHLQYDSRFLVRRVRPLRFHRWRHEVVSTSKAKGVVSSAPTKPTLRKAELSCTFGINPSHRNRTCRYTDLSMDGVSWPWL